MSPLKNATVLVVDDEPDLCDMLAFEFRLQGSRVLSAGDGDGAFQLIQSQRVDAVITDIQMAHGDGVQLLERIRARHSNGPPVLFITAYDTALSPAEAYDRGAEGIFGKPFRLKDLIDRVDRVLTVPERRWAQRPEATGAIRVAFEWPSLHYARDRRCLDIGRGGIAVSVDGGVPLEELEPGRQVGFDVRFQGGPIDAIEGAGIVRWLMEDSNALAVCGIEFDYLSPPSRQSVLPWLEANPCRPFIPRLIG